MNDQSIFQDESPRLRAWWFSADNAIAAAVGEKALRTVDRETFRAVWDRFELSVWAGQVRALQGEFE